MLPGFRFLVAAIVFSVSVLVFGLGAAALFRAAHEQFASSSSWRATAESSYTSFLPPAEPSRPVIAMLRIEPPLARAPSSEPHTDLASTDTPPETSAASTAASDPAIVAAAPIEPASAIAAPPADTPSANAAPASTPDGVTVASAAPPATDTDGGETDMAKTEAATTEVADAVPPDPAPPAPDLVTAAAPKLDTPAPMPATSPSPVPTEPAVARKDVLPTFAEAQIPTGVAVVTSDASNATPLPTPVPSRSDLLAQMIALSADRATANDERASIKTASLRLHQSLAKRRLAKERLAKERLAKERLAEARRARLHRQMAERARAAREAAAQQQQQQQQQLANPFAQPQAFAQPPFGQQTAQQTR